jgi:hypothetical protein
MDLQRFWMISPEIHSIRKAKETHTDTHSLLLILSKRKSNPKELISLREFSLTDKARKDFVPQLKSNLKINFK